MINRPFFFDFVKSSLFGGTLRSTQVAGLIHILDVWEDRHARLDDRWLAYALGTAHHEVDATMRPIHEYGGSAYFKRRYDIEGERPAFARDVLGNVNRGDGVLFHGRGFVQLTGRRNYTVMQAYLRQDLTSSAAAADKALELSNASSIMFKGMIDGVFTGKKLSDYFNPGKEDWVAARRIINGTDKANLVAGYARRYYAALSHTT